MIRIRDNGAAIFIRSRDSEAAVLENIENTKGKRGKGEEEEKKKPRRFESLVVSRDAITATGRTNFLRFDLKCHLRSGIEGEEVNERKGEGVKEREGSLSNPWNRSGWKRKSSRICGVPLNTGGPDLIGDDRLNKLSGHLHLSTPYSDRARGSTIGFYFRSEERNDFG